MLGLTAALQTIGPSAHLPGASRPTLLRGRSGRLDRIFREYLLDPLERLLRGRLRRHPVLEDVRPSGAKNVLVAYLCPGRVIDKEIRRSRPEQRLFYIRLAVRILAPPRIVFDDRGKCGNVPAEPNLEVIVGDLGLDQILHKVL